MRFPPPVRRSWLHALAAVALLLVGLSTGCHPPLRSADFSGRTPVVRVLLLSGRSTVSITADVPPTASLLGDPDTRRVDLPPATPVPLTLTATGWRLGVAALSGRGELTIRPATEGSVRVDGRAYRGRFRFVPHLPPSPGSRPTFDVVNDVDVENYLRGVVARELPAGFAPAAYAAQCVVARTYVLYAARTTSTTAHFDVYADERSQVYGGLAGESTKAEAAVEATAGEVVAYGPPGRERIFKAYYSSCCGGLGQSAADAFGDVPIPPLDAQRRGLLCDASPSYDWPAVVVTKAELTRRFRRWGLAHNRPERDMGAVTRLDATASNAIGRPVRFAATDARGRRFTLSGEELRTAVNTDAPPEGRLPSSLFRLDNRPAAIGFVDGHGRGHGVGMCQWCAQAWATRGSDYRQIVAAAFPGSVILRAY